MNYPPCMTLRPLTAWPTEFTYDRGRSPFRSTFNGTIELLDRELYHLGAGRGHYPPSVLQIALREQDFRINGMPRANAIPAHPGVIVSVESNKGPLSFPCDKFDRWQDNLRAIALGLEALRKIDRYGITPGNEQYRGWQAIEAKSVDATTSACVVLARIAWPNENSAAQASWAHKISTDVEIGRNTLRQARIKAHPDRHNGDRALSDQVEGAAEVLRRSGIEWFR